LLLEESSVVGGLLLELQSKLLNDLISFVDLLRHGLHVVSALLFIRRHLSQLLFHPEELVVVLVSYRLIEQKLVTLGLHGLETIAKPCL